MNPILRNILAVLAGLVGGSVINSLLVQAGHSLVPLPEGFDWSDIESARELLKQAGWKEMAFPWLAHAMGTLSGAFICAKLAASYALRLSLIIGGVFLAGGMYMISVYSGPTWFIYADLLLAYIPMAYLGFRLSGK